MAEELRRTARLASRRRTVADGVPLFAPDQATGSAGAEPGVDQVLSGLLAELGEKADGEGTSGDSADVAGRPPRSLRLGGKASGAISRAISGAQDDGAGEVLAPATRKRREAASLWLRELRAARDRLNRELETNLKQLRKVLAEGERIAADLEAVVRETRSPGEGDRA